MKRPKVQFYGMGCGNIRWKSPDSAFAPQLGRSSGRSMGHGYSYRPSAQVAPSQPIPGSASAQDIPDVPSQSTVVMPSSTNITMASQTSSPSTLMLSNQSSSVTNVTSAIVAAAADPSQPDPSMVTPTNAVQNATPVAATTTPVAADHTTTAIAVAGAYILFKTLF